VHGGAVPGLDLGVEFTAHVLDRLLDLSQKWFEAGVESLTSHDRSRVAAPSMTIRVLDQNGSSPTVDHEGGPGTVR
jgi:hypothetical protein